RPSTSCRRWPATCAPPWAASRTDRPRPEARPERARAEEVLVIGVRRRTAVGKLLMGSAAQRILMDVDCPVLAVKSPPAD
ncbi:universal stress protein, partial [Modestobacter sp. I12A-02662]|uniref:universal stress protein n=1 Tax=Modestobacter sp. I12A-02662 TaxID=1730496 RepID=UPI0034DF63BE